MVRILEEKLEQWHRDEKKNSIQQEGVAGSLRRARRGEGYEQLLSSLDG